MFAALTYVEKRIKPIKQALEANIKASQSKSCQTVYLYMCLSYYIYKKQNTARNYTMNRRSPTPSVAGWPTHLHVIPLFPNTHFGGSREGLLPHRWSSHVEGLWHHGTINHHSFQPRGATEEGRTLSDRRSPIHTNVQNGTDGVKMQLKKRNKGRKKSKGKRGDWKRSRYRKSDIVWNPQSPSHFLEGPAPHGVDSDWLHRCSKFLPASCNRECDVLPHTNTHTNTHTHSDVRPKSKGLSSKDKSHKI